MQGTITTHQHTLRRERQTDRQTERERMRERDRQTDKTKFKGLSVKVSV